MNFYTRLALGVLGVGVIAGAWYADEYYTKKEQEEKKVTAKALNFETQNVRKLVMKTSDSQFAFERKDAAAKWEMIDPAKGVKPDEDAVNNLVSALQSLSVETELEGSEDGAKSGSAEFAKFGFDKPKGEFSVFLEGGKELKLAIGNELSVGSSTSSTFTALSLYATTPERKKVLVVNSAISSSLKKSYSDFRTKVAGEFVTADVEGILLSNNLGLHVELTKGDKGWKITQPADLAADFNNVGLFLDKWGKLRTDKVIEKDTLKSEDLATYGLSAPNATVEFRGKDAKLLQKFEVGLNKEAMFVTMADGSLGQVELSKFADYVPALKFFRDRRIMRDLLMADVQKLVTKSGKEFQKEGEAWYQNSADKAAAAPVDTTSPNSSDKKTSTSDATQPSAKVADKDAQEVYTQWEFMTADDVIDKPMESLSNMGLEPPVQKVTFQFREGSSKPVEVLVGNKVPKDEKLVYVKRVDKNEIFTVESKWLEALNRIDGSPGQSPQAQK